MTRTPFMKKVLASTVHSVPKITVANRRLEGAWEQAISDLLVQYADKGDKEAGEILREAGGDPMTAAYLVTNSN